MSDELYMCMHLPTVEMFSRAHAVRRRAHVERCRAHAYIVVESYAPLTYTLVSFAIDHLENASCEIPCISRWVVFRNN